MQRINSTDQLFHDGDPFNGVQGTVVTAAWLNSVQEELAAIVENAGQTLDPAQPHQVLAALLQIAAIAVTQTAGDSSVKVATDAFVQTATGGVATVNVAGNTNVALTQSQWGRAIIVLTGALTGNISVTVPAAGDQWIVINNTTGAFGVTFKATGGTGVALTQGRSALLYCDGANVLYANSDPRAAPGSGADIYINAATPLFVGKFNVDTSAGIPFVLPLPANPVKGDSLTFTDFAATWGITPFTLGRNGKTIMGQASDMVVNVSDQSFSIGFNGSDWRLF